MDQTSHRLEQDINEIVHTRLAIEDKLEMLEQRVRETVEETTMTIKDVVDRTKQTVEDAIQKTTQVLDPTQHVDQYPWVMLGGAVCLGYVLGLLESRLSGPRSGVYPYVPSGVRGASTMPPTENGGDSAARRSGVYPYYPSEHDGEASAKSQPHETSVWDSLSHEFSDDVQQAKHALVQAGRSLVYEFVRQVLPRIVHSLGIQPFDERGDKSTHSFRS